MKLLLLCIFVVCLFLWEKYHKEVFLLGTDGRLYKKTPWVKILLILSVLSLIVLSAI